MARQSAARLSRSDLSCWLGKQQTDPVHWVQHHLFAKHGETDESQTWKRLKGASKEGGKRDWSYYHCHMKDLVRHFRILFAERNWYHSLYPKPFYHSLMKEKRRGGFYCCINYVPFCLTSHTKPLMGSDERTIYKDKIINDKSNLGLMYALAILSRVASDFYINLFHCFFVIYLLWRILKDNHGIYTIAAPGSIEKNISPTQLFVTCCWNESFCQNHHLSVERGSTQYTRVKKRMWFCFRR